jgi:hypothetical protein
LCTSFNRDKKLSVSLCVFRAPLQRSYEGHLRLQTTRAVPVYIGVRSALAEQGYEQCCSLELRELLLASFSVSRWHQQFHRYGMIASVS